MPEAESIADLLLTNLHISMFDVNGSEISHHGFGIGAGHIKPRHWPARGLSRTRDRRGQQFDKLGVAPRWQTGKPWNGVRPSFDRPGRLIKHRCTFEPSGVVWVAVPITGRVTVSATCHTFYDVFASRNERCSVAVFRGGLRAPRLRRGENVRPSKNRQYENGAQQSSDQEGSRGSDIHRSK